MRDLVDDIMINESVDFVEEQDFYCRLKSRRPAREKSVAHVFISDE